MKKPEIPLYSKIALIISAIVYVAYKVLELLDGKGVAVYLGRFTHVFALSAVSAAVLLFVSGIIVTLLIALISAASGSVLGFAAFLLYRKEKTVPNKILNMLSAFLQMTPVVVILMIFYYLIFAQSRLDGIVVSMIAFSLMYACSVLGLFKTSVKAVDRGQTEAVMALGYEDTRGFLRMIHPQALPHWQASSPVR